ncbi:MAG: HpcH/HpaI aldolase family protein [Eubacteriales bacterium]
MKVKLREIFQKGNYALGGFLSIGAPAIVEVVALGGLDFIVIDTEHGEPGFESVVNMSRAAQAHGVTPIVRVLEYNQKLIGRYLDNGIEGIQMPMVETADMAAKFIAACKYKPDGVRGLSGGRGSMWGHIQNYTTTVNRELMTISMCESKKGVDNIEEIVKVPHLDVIFVGIGDLSLSMGCVGKTDNPEVLQAIDHVLHVCLEADIIPGIVASGAIEALQRIEQGFKYVTVLNDMRILCSATKAITTKVRER